MACSAGILNEPDSHYDMARVGILHYGFWPNNETWERYAKSHALTQDPLMRVIRWWSRSNSKEPAEPRPVCVVGAAIRIL